MSTTRRSQHSSDHSARDNERKPSSERDRQVERPAAYGPQAPQRVRADAFQAPFIPAPRCWVRARFTR